LNHRLPLAYRTFVVAMSKPPPDSEPEPPRADAVPTSPPNLYEEQPQRRRRKLSAIMMADVTGFSRLMGADEEGTVNVIRDFHRRVQALVEQFEGRVVDTAGDSVFGEFDSVVNAVRCARGIQEELALANVARLPEPRIGVHLGDVIVEDYHVYGDGVNIAARLELLAEPGGICLSEAVYQQIRDKLDVQVEDLGMHQLKNIQHPIRLYKILSMAPAAAILASPPATAPTGGLVAATPRRFDTSSATWHVELARPTALVMLILGAFLLSSQLFLFSTAGTFPTGGAVLLGLTLGRAWQRVAGRRGGLLVGLGIGIATGAIWTDWSGITNSVFVLGGLIVAALGLQQRRT